MSRVLVLAGGSPHAHDFTDTGAAMASVAEAAGHDVEIVAHPDSAAVRLTDALPGRGLDALVVLGLWWQMHGDAYECWRAQYAYSCPPGTRAALADFVSGGGGMVAVHTAPICFDDWPEWGDIVGGSWAWGVSSHPPYGPVEADVIGEHPVTAGLPHTIVLHDEVYGDLDVRPGVEVLATARRSVDDDDQPIVWAHRFGRGRVVFDGFGHDAESIRHLHNGRMLRQAIAWVCAGDR
jgi:uncharacterized protein